MNIASILNIALWIIWGLPALIVGLCFAFRGAKRGTVPALISVGSTLVAAILSWLIAHLIGGFIASGLAGVFNFADSLADLIEGSVSTDLSVIAASANVIQLVDCIAKSVVTVAIFGILMFIFSIIIKNIVSAIVTKKVSLPGKFSWGGFAISLVDAILLVSLIMLPTFGTLGLVRDVEPIFALSTQQDATSEEDAIGSDSEEALQLVTVVAKNPLIVAYDSQPLAFVYDSLCGAPLSGTVFSPSYLVRNSADVATKGIALANAEEVAFNDDSRNFAIALVKFLDGNKALKPVCLDVFNTVVSAYDVAKGVEDEDSQKFGKILAVFKDVVNNLLTQDVDANNSDRLDSLEMLSVGAVRFLKTSTSGASSEDLASMIPTFNALGNILEGIARHPAIGVDGVMNVFKSLVNELGLADSMPMLAQDSTIESIRNTLTTALTKEVKDEFTASFLSTLIETAASFASEEEVDMTKLLTADPAVLDTIKSMVSTETLKGMGLDKESAEMAAGMVGALVDTIKATDLTEEEAEAEGALLGSVMSAVMNDGTIDKATQEQLKNSKIVNALAENPDLDAETRKMLNDFLGK